MTAPRDRVAIVGAGIGGLAAATTLASAGMAVTVLEKEAAPGGKIRQIAFGNIGIDAGPTVFTMRWIFDEIAAAAGTVLDDLVTLRPATVLARHAWDDTGYLDLFADRDASAEAIRDFAGSREADGYRKFCEQAEQTYRTLERSFIRSNRPSPMTLVALAGVSGIADLWRISPFETLWAFLGRYFRDIRLRQLFGRYATYCGSSPFLAPATLMLIAHVEQTGVWLVEGGMHRLARAFAGLARSKSATILCNTNVAAIEADGDGVIGVRLDSGETIPAGTVIANADISALSSGRFGKAVGRAVPSVPFENRSLSAITVNSIADTGGFPLARHTVFFSGDYEAEFDALFGAGAIPQEPTIYVCAQDRDDTGARPGSGAERIFCLVNAPADGDRCLYGRREREKCESNLYRRLERCGLTLRTDPARTAITTPLEFHRLFPGTGGGLYGRASHGWSASFQRPTARTKIPGLYLAGGSVHPGAGVPMAALSGKMAAEAVLKDCGSMRRSSATATDGGMPTH